MTRARRDDAPGGRGRSPLADVLRPPAERSGEDAAEPRAESANSDRGVNRSPVAASHRHDAERSDQTDLGAEGSIAPDGVDAAGVDAAGVDAAGAGAGDDPVGDDPAGDDPAALGAELEALAGPVPEPARGNEERERDRECVRRAQAGEQGAFRELFERHHKRAFAVAYGVLKNKQDALDVVQESFVKVHRHLPSFQGTSSFYTWLYRIVMNLAIDQLRRRKTSRPVEYDDAALREADMADDTILPRMLDSNPRKTVIRRELMARVEAALATLPEYHRQVIILREIEGLSYEEMAEALEVPKGTIMSRLFHARRKMQVALQDYVEDNDLELEEEE
jgi:RNA polymerase sigma-70 factor (ECF subfamily)